MSVPLFKCKSVILLFSFFFSAYPTLLKRKLVFFLNPGFVVMLELLIRDLKASITVHCQQLESYSIAFAEEHTT